MPLPGGLTTITVTGTFLDAKGNAASGTVTFAPSTPVLTDSAGHAVLTMPVTVVLSSGRLSVVLPTTDNASLLPAPWTYTVSVALEGMPASACPGKAIPSTLGSTVDLSALLP